MLQMKPGVTLDNVVIEDHLFNFILPLYTIVVGHILNHYCKIMDINPDQKKLSRLASLTTKEKREMQLHKDARDDLFSMIYVPHRCVLETLTCSQSVYPRNYHYFNEL